VAIFPRLEADRAGTVPSGSAYPLAEASLLDQNPKNPLGAHAADHANAAILLAC
jgi:hypothetical protein